jgi:hypothetical protein
VGTLVTAATETRAGATIDPAQLGVLVWIDAREAVVVRWTGEEAAIERLSSDVPAHARAARHVRYDPLTRHGGPDRQSAVERRRIEHLDRFVDMAGPASPRQYLVIVGGTVTSGWARLRELDAWPARGRSTSAAPITRAERQPSPWEHIGAGPRRQRLCGETGQMTGSATSCRSPVIMAPPARDRVTTCLVDARLHVVVLPV